MVQLEQDYGNSRLVELASDLLSLGHRVTHNTYQVLLSSAII